MSKKANPTVVGGFVMGAIALILTGVMMFGTGRLFDERFTIVSFFEGSVTGLQVGAPVEFRGVPVGTVTAIRALYDPEETSLMIPVYMTLARNSVTNVKFDTLERSPEEELAIMIDHGLRARLDIRSLVTGQMFVALDFHPDTPPTLVGVDADTLEIPSTTSRMDKVTSLLDKLDFDELAAKGILALDGINDVVHSAYLQDTLEQLSLTTRNANRLMVALEGRVGTLSEATVQTLEQANRSMAKAESALAGTLEDLSRTAVNMDGNVDRTARRLEAVLAEVESLARNLDSQVEPLSLSARGALDQATVTLRSTDEVVAQDSRTRYNLDLTLEELAAARAVRLMAEYIQQNPDALLRGKAR